MSYANRSQKNAQTTGGPKALAQSAPSELRIGEASDSFEQEADRMADEVMSGSRGKSSWSFSGMAVNAPLQRKCDCGGSGECEACSEKKTLQRKSSGEAQAGETKDGVAPPIVHEVLQSSGEPLDPGLRSRMENRFGASFAHIRIHANSKAAESARSVNALAYTVGEHIAFASGRYAPQTTEGARLLAHELAHTVQQRNVRPRNTSFSEVRVGHDAAAEQEAHQAANTGAAAKRVATRPDQVGRLARQSAGEAMPVPSPKVETDDPFKDIGHSRAYGRGKFNAPSTWGWSSPETNNLYHQCNIAPLEREKFKQFVKSLPPSPTHGREKPPKAEEVLGFVSYNPNNAKAPVIDTTAVQEDGKTVYKLKPTHAEMPPMRSAYTQAGRYVEGFQQDITDECKDIRIRQGTSKFPLNWIITEAGAQKIKEGEQEHCNDIRAAFDLTLGLYASAINNLAASERTYSKPDDAVKEATRAAGVTQDSMLSQFNDAALKTKFRDDSEWHTAQAIGDKAKKDLPKKIGCDYFFTIDGTSWPQIGVHDSSEVMNMIKAVKPVKPAQR
jgi:hypothetical protein